MSRETSTQALREALAELIDAMERYEMSVEESPPRRHTEMMRRARAALAEALASDFDRAEFDELLREVVALREWKAAHEAAAFRAAPAAAPCCGAPKCEECGGCYIHTNCPHGWPVRELRAVDGVAPQPAPSGPTDETAARSIVVGAKLDGIALLMRRLKADVGRASVVHDDRFLAAIRETSQEIWRELVDAGVAASVTPEQEKP